MQRKTNEAGLAIIKKYEGLRLQAYLCEAGKPTIGWGHTQGVRLGDRITREQAEEFLRQDVQDAEAAVSRLVKAAINDNQFSALVSFVFNLGAGTLQKSTLLKLLNFGLPWLVPFQIKRFVYQGKRKLPGLVARRAAEAELFARRP